MSQSSLTCSRVHLRNDTGNPPPDLDYTAITFLTPCSCVHLRNDTGNPREGPLLPVICSVFGRRLEVARECNLKIHWSPAANILASFYAQLQASPGATRHTDSIDRQPRKPRHLFMHSSKRPLVPLSTPILITSREHPGILLCTAPSVPWCH